MVNFLNSLKELHGSTKIYHQHKINQFFIIHLTIRQIYSKPPKLQKIYNYFEFIYSKLTFHIFLQFILKFSDDFDIIIVNIVNQDDIFDTLKTLTNDEFTYVEDTPALNIWKNMNAKKDDIVIFKRDGTKKVHLSMSNKRKEIFLGPKDGASCEIVDQVQPM